MQLTAIILISLSGFLSGVLILLGYMLYRMMQNDGWDDSNLTNALRLLSHVVLHPTDFARMFYLSDEALQVLMRARNTDEIKFHRPFWYVDKDELSEVVESRP